MREISRAGWKFDGHEWKGRSRGRTKRETSVRGKERNTNAARVVNSTNLFGRSSGFRVSVTVVAKGIAATDSSDRGGRWIRRYGVEWEDRREAEHGVDRR